MKNNPALLTLKAFRFKLKRDYNYITSRKIHMDKPAFYDGLLHAINELDLHIAREENLCQPNKNY